MTTGEAAIGICFLQDAVDLMLNEGYGDVIGISTASEGTGYELGGVAIINNAPDMASAQKFVDFVLTAEAQEIDQEYGHYVFLTNPDAKCPMLLPSWQRRPSSSTSTSSGLPKTRPTCWPDGKR